MQVHSIMYWLAASPGRYRAVVWAALALLIVSVVRAWIKDWRDKEARHSKFSCLFFGVCVLLVLYAGRWPVFFMGDLWNMDECQMMAGALTLLKHPIFYHSVDGTTTGPLNDYVLLLPALFGAPINFMTARIVGVLLLATSLLALYYAFRQSVTESVARTAILPAVLFFSFATYWDFVHYTSEHAPMALLCLGLAALCAGMARGPGSQGRTTGLVLAGLFLGCAPFAKLQVAPMSAWLVLFTCGRVLWSSEGTRATRRQDLGALGLGLLSYPLAVAALLLAFGAFGDFWQSYVVNNISYAQETWSRVGYFDFVLRTNESEWRAFTGTFGFILTSLPIAMRFRTGGLRLLLLFAGWVLSTWLSYVLAKRTLTHYLVLMVVPLSALAGAMLARQYELLWFPERRKAFFCQYLALFVALCLMPQVVFWTLQPNPYVAAVSRYRDNITSPVARQIQAFARPDEAMSVWGWMPLYYVQTGMHQATREGHTDRQIQPGPQQVYYRQRYLKDFSTSQPPVFLDAVGPGNFGFQDRERYGHEIFPELAALIARHYTQVNDIEGVRIYVRNDRL